jgi:hypothetical protein
MQSGQGASSGGFGGFFLGMGVVSFQAIQAAVKIKMATITNADKAR